MAREKQSMDGNTAAAHVAYAFTEVAGICLTGRFRQMNLKENIYKFLFFEDYI